MTIKLSVLFSGFQIYKVTLRAIATGINVAAALIKFLTVTSVQEIHTRTVPPGLFAAPHATILSTWHSFLHPAVVSLHLVSAPFPTYLTFPLQTRVAESIPIVHHMLDITFYSLNENSFPAFNVIALSKSQFDLS